MSEWTLAALLLVGYTAAVVLVYSLALLWVLGRTMRGTDV